MDVSAVQIVINQATCNYRDIYDTCAGVVGEYALAGCISQAPTFVEVTADCSQLVGEYALAGCISYVPGATGGGGGGGDQEVGGTDIGDSMGEIG